MTRARDLVFVTGAGGFIGSNIARTLSRGGRPVVLCDRFTQPGSWEYLAPVLARDIVLAEEAMAWLEAHEKDVAAIVHVGAISSTTETDVPALIKNNVRFSLDLWDYAARCDCTFIYASSAATYGDGSQGFRDDDSSAGLAELRPLNGYAWSKHVVDRRIVDDVEHGRPTPPRWAGLKFFNVYGPNEGHKGTMRSVVHQLYAQVAAGRPAKLFKADNAEYPDGGQMRDFVYVKDCCAVVENMLAAPSLAGIFNVGTGTARTFADLAAAVFAAMGAEPNIEYIEMPEAIRGRYQYFTQADVAKLTSSGLAPAFHTLEAGVADYVQGYLMAEAGAGRETAPAAQV
jgi:ADP-L-glycero-D-manno-heptose 6-epimerase